MYDTNKDLIHKSTNEGGTHITNFDFKELLEYKKSTETYNKLMDYKELVISTFAYDNTGRRLSDCYSLHKMGNMAPGLDDFWKLHDTIRKLLKSPNRK